MTWLSWINMVATGSLFVHAVCVINRMTRRTNHIFRVAYVILGVGSIAAVLGPFYGYLHPQFSEVLINIGAALALIVGRFLRHGGFKHEGYSSLIGDLRYYDGRKP